jgi:hypothetical protein
MQQQTPHTMEVTITETGEIKISEYGDMHGMGILNQAYAYHAVVIQALANGYNVVDQKAQGGTLWLQLAKR